METAERRIFEETVSLIDSSRLFFHHSTHQAVSSRLRSGLHDHQSDTITCSIGTVKLDKTSGPAIRTDHVFHSVIS